MTQMFTEYAIFQTVRDAKGCRYGVQRGTTRFGYVPNPEEGRDYEVGDRQIELDTALRRIGTRFEQLPRKARAAFESGSGFTLVSGVGPKHYERNIRLHELISQVRDHTQMLTSLEYCDVYVVHNGKLVSGCDPLKPSEVLPIPGGEKPRVVDIPEFLEDPIDGVSLSTTDERRLPAGKLVLRTSKRSMRWKKKSRHTINYKTANGFIGYKSMLEFPVQSGYRDNIYGECELEALDPFKQNVRGALADSPLTQAVDYFIAEQIEAYAQEFEKRDRKAYSKKERNALSEMNEALDRWKNHFIKSFVEGVFGPGGVHPIVPRLPAGKAARIEVSTTHPRLGIGVAVRPTIRFFDARNKQIRPVPYQWVSEDPNVAMVIDDLMLVNSFAPGQTLVYAETLEGNLQSNRVPLEVVRIRSIQIEPGKIEVKTGSRTKLRAVCSLSCGDQLDDVALIWTEDNASVARVSPNGVVFGAGAGETEITAGDDRITSANAVTVNVVEGDTEDKGEKKGAGKGTGKQRGRGYPLILVSGEVGRPDPDSNDYVHFSPDNPPVMQRPEDIDRNIWWINSAAPLATMYLDKDLDYGYDSREWRMYHLERYINIITEIAMTYDPKIDGKLTVGEYFLYSGDKMAEIQAAMAEELSAFIKDGTIPEV